jgi:hypothetical protein
MVPGHLFNELTPNSGSVPTELEVQDAENLSDDFLLKKNIAIHQSREINVRVPSTRFLRTP